MVVRAVVGRPANDFLRERPADVIVDLERRREVCERDSGVGEDECEDPAVLEGLGDTCALVGELRMRLDREGLADKSELRDGPK